MISQKHEIVPLTTMPDQNSAVLNILEEAYKTFTHSVTSYKSVAFPNQLEFRKLLVSTLPIKMGVGCRCYFNRNNDFKIAGKVLEANFIGQTKKAF